MTLKSLYELLSDDNYFLQIPKIQRDYAQGRTNDECTRKREDFFKYLYSKILGKYGAILDFIYGKEETENDRTTIELIDGQQRCTTLFLLHVYALKQAQAKMEEIEYRNHQSNLEKFSYDTRESSKRFCKALIQEEYTIPQEIKHENKHPFTEEIKKQKWYHSAYDDDQTVKAMLVSLEDIHALFNAFQKDDLWKNLTTDKKIQFHFIPITNLGLTDDIYIKMNNRGKELEDFENLKAEIEERIVDDCQNPTEERYLADYKDFKSNIDTTWTDFLWTYYNFNQQDDPNKEINKSFMRLMSVCIMYNSDNAAVISKIQKNDKKENISDFLFYKDGNLNEQRRDQPGIEDKEYTKKIFEMFCDFLDVYSSDKNITTTTPEITFWNDDKDKNFVTKIIHEDEPTHCQRSMFLAHTLYFKKIKGQFDSKKYNDWMRVVRNLVYKKEGSGFYGGRAQNNFVIREAKDMHNLWSLIIKLSEHCDDIYSHLSETNETNAVGVKQYYQEVQKAKLIKKHRELIHDLEDNYVLHGNIDFAILCADGDPNNNDKNITWGEEDIEWNNLDKINSVFKKCFNNPDEELPHDFRRAILSTTDTNEEFYLYQSTQLSRAMTVTRGNLFRNLEDLIYIISVENINTPRYRYAAIYIKKLILLLTNTNNSYEKIIENFINDKDKYNHFPAWKRNIIEISSKEWINKSYQPYIAVNYNENNQNNYYLLKGSVSPDGDDFIDITNSFS